LAAGAVGTRAETEKGDSLDQRTELLELEHAAWRALSSNGDNAASFYADVLAKDVLMLLPGGLLIDDRERVVESMRGAPWSGFEISDERVVELTPDSAVIAYRATAHRGGRDYEALFTSTYVRDGGGWKLVLHQQTPI
jgi:hypothetical protein